MLDSLKNKNKFGFSLFEVVVTMGIIAVFIAACSNVFTQRHKKRITTPNHGRYECYRSQDGGIVYERQFNEGVEVIAQRNVAGRCRFKPPKQASYLIVTAIGGGGYGGPTNGGSAGAFTSTFLASTSHWLEMVPGRAAATAATERGENTQVYDRGTSGIDPERLIIDVKGGKSDSSNSLTFKNCNVATAKYNCGAESICTEKVDIPGQEDSVEVTYCAGPSVGGTIDPTLVKTVKIPFINSVANGDRDYDDGCNDTVSASWRSSNKNIRSLKDENAGLSAAEMAQGGVTYTYSKTRCTDSNRAEGAETITYFRLNLQVEGNYTSDPDYSELNGYINTLNIENGVAAGNGLTGNSLRRYSTGDGGARNERGGNGAVLVIW